MHWHSPWPSSTRASKLTNLQVREPGQIHTLAPVCPPGKICRTACSTGLGKSLHSRTSLMSQSTNFSHPTQELATQTWSCQHTSRVTEDAGTGWRDKTSLLLLTAGSTGCFSSPRPCSSPRRTHTRSLPIALPGPGTYTLPRLVGPNTALIHTNPCCSMRGKSEHDGFAEDLSKVKLRFSALSHQQLKLSCSPQGRRAPTPAAAPLNSHFPAAATTSKKPQVPWLSRC